jgi:diadenosine tetraphosphate (Ap4A) HIT family hydrolase
MTAPRVEGCPLCDEAGGRLVFEAPKFRVIHAAEVGFPGFYRVVWNAHVAEWSDLAPDDRALCMEAVAVVEQCLRDVLAPVKVNLAALGNMVPHLHWHVIARFEEDSHFPSPVWAAAQRESDPERERAIEVQLPTLEREMVRRLATRSF